MNASAPDQGALIDKKQWLRKIWSNAAASEMDETTSRSRSVAAYLEGEARQHISGGARNRGDGGFHRSTAYQLPDRAELALSLENLLAERREAQSRDIQA